MSPTDHRRAFVLRLGAVGDIVLTTPVLAALKRDGYHVTLCAKPHAVTLLKGTGLVDEWIVWDKALEARVDAEVGENEWQRTEAAIKIALGMADGYDKIVNLVGIVEGRLMKKVWDIPGERLAAADGPELYARYGLGQRETFRPTDENHVDALLAEAGFDPTLIPDSSKRPVWRVLPDERAWWRKKAKKLGIKASDFLVVYQLTGSGIAKTWPFAAEFCAGIKRMIPNAKVLLLGYGSDEVLAMGWPDRMPWVIPFAVGRCPVARGADGEQFYVSHPASYRQDGAIVEAADLYVGPDTSFLHVAGALGTPSVPLYTVTNHEQIGKYYPSTFPVQSRSACSPCGLLVTGCRRGPIGVGACMENISAASVLRSVEEARKCQKRKVA